MSERAAMKRRVRGVLRRRWFGPLLACVLALIPMAAVAALLYFLAWPKVSAGQVIDFAAMGLTAGGAMDLLLAFGMLLGGALAVDMQALGELGIALIAPAAVYLLIALPVRTSLSGYFLALLRGKKPSPFAVFNCFSARYPRAFIGMLLNEVWLLLWAAAAFVCPFVLYTVGQTFVPAVTEMLGLINSWYVWGGLIILCLVWFAVFTLVFINRAIAFSFTPVCIAAHPRLPGLRAPRLSRLLARGCKWRLIGLYLSFLPWYLPCIVSVALFFAAAYLAPMAGISGIYLRYARVFLLAVAAVNQLVIIFVGPYAAACRHAFYIERKREALMDEEVNPDDFGKKVRPEKPVKKTTPEEKE